MDVGKIAQSIAKNATIFGYPKVIIFCTRTIENIDGSLVGEKPHGAEEDKDGLTFKTPLVASMMGGEQLANKHLIGDATTFFWDIFVATVRIRSKLKFTESFCSKVEQFHGARHFEEIFNEVVRETKPKKWQVLSCFRNRLFMTQGKGYFFILLLSLGLRLLSSNGHSNDCLTKAD